MPDLSLSQRLTQTQTQVMSQRQIQSLGLLSQSTDDLRETVYKAADENPALQIVRDTVASGRDLTARRGPASSLKISSSTSSFSEQASDAFQQVLEAQEDQRESLQDHLLHQLNMLNLQPPVPEICEKLIRNLNDKGNHLRAPVSLLDEKDPLQTQECLDYCLNLVQQLDPVGCCTNDVNESLLVQAEFKGNAPELALFLLKGRLELLNPPQPDKAAKKIKAWIASQKELFGQQEDFGSLEVTEASVKEALDFIRTLNPYPAQDFSISETHFVSPDVYIDFIPEEIEKDDFAKGLVKTDSGTFRIRSNKDLLPQLEINSEYEKLAASSDASKEDKKHASDMIRKAEDFRKDLEFRQDTILRTVYLLVKTQHKFFKYGPGNLVPLKQSDIAEQLKIHESTVSRTARSKYLQCDWGLFDLQYFFSSAVKTSKPKTAENPASKDVSRDQVLNEIKKILDEHKDEEKKLSDQKVSDILAERGMIVARRTVAKYRSLLDIQSSYTRQ